MVKQAEEDALFEEWHETLLRVRYSETDKMGIVHHANFLIWFEIGRTEFCRDRGFSYREMEETDDAFLVVAESYCRYKAPAHFDDQLLVRDHARTSPQGLTRQRHIVRHHHAAAISHRTRQDEFLVKLSVL